MRSSGGARRPELDRDDVVCLLDDLEQELASVGVRAELHLLGGAAIIMSYDADRVTDDIDAVFVPKDKVFEAANAVARREHWRRRGLPSDWLNDDVGIFLPAGWPSFSGNASARYLEVEVAEPERLLAMKMLASRAEDHDDIATLTVHLGIRRADEATAVMRKYFPKAVTKFDRARLTVERVLVARSVQEHSTGRRGRNRPDQTLRPVTKASSGSRAARSASRPAKLHRCSSLTLSGHRCRNELLAGSRCPAHGWRAPS